jgi:hypothetical protein
LQSCYKFITSIQFASLRDAPLTCSSTWREWANLLYAKTEHFKEGKCMSVPLKLDFWSIGICGSRGHELKSAGVG